MNILLSSIKLTAFLTTLLPYDQTVIKYIRILVNIDVYKFSVSLLLPEDTV